MNRQTVNSMQTVSTLPLRQLLFIGVALVLTIVAGQFYHSVQTARLADQVAAQTALLAKIQATRSTSLVKAAETLPQAPVANASPATIDNVVPQERWVF
ncbi:hypothetical protein [Pseudomonas cremoricolorata]|uniref:Uncharacterized protein n=1 Tax=Pseudomonas cremoricolorata TaxID=157783 RepID=A0A089YAV8_9PSED|nr:hypothetical protein [Pseudomonas cremoricolorata]AIR88968.1 hypothetical protein LK03_06640 [Pseudomonas cremoricolorata]